MIRRKKKDTSKLGVKRNRQKNVAKLSESRLEALRQREWENLFQKYTSKSQVQTSSWDCSGDWIVDVMDDNCQENENGETVIRTVANEENSSVTRNITPNSSIVCINDEYTVENEVVMKDMNVVEENIINRKTRLQSENNTEGIMTIGDGDNQNVAVPSTLSSSTNQDDLTVKCKENDGVSEQLFTRFKNLSQCSSKNASFVFGNAASEGSKTSQKNKKVSDVKKVVRLHCQNNTEGKLKTKGSTYQNVEVSGAPLSSIGCKENGDVSNEPLQNATNLCQYSSRNKTVVFDNTTFEKSNISKKMKVNFVEEDVNEEAPNLSSENKLKSVDLKTRKSRFSHIPKEKRKEILKWDAELSYFIRYRWNDFKNNPGSVWVPFPKRRSIKKL